MPDQHGKIRETKTHDHSFLFWSATSRSVWVQELSKCIWDLQWLTESKSLSIMRKNPVDLTFVPLKNGDINHERYRGENAALLA